MNRIFVEKQAAHAQEAHHLLHDLRESLGLPGLASVRVVQRYDVDGLSAAEFREAVEKILSEPQVDAVSDTLARGDQDHAFAVEYLPGQFDQRADSAAQCIQILTGRERPEVRSAKVVVLEGALDADELARVKSYVINAVDSHEVPVDAASLRQPAPAPADVEWLADFHAAEPAGVRALLGLAMSAEDVAFCQAYFRDEERRAPSITEIRMLDTYWSDHCRHTTFLTRIEEVGFDDPDGPARRAWEAYLATREALGRGDRPVTLMDIALVGMRELRASGELDNLEESDEVNAASIVVPVEVSRRPEAGGASVTTTEEWLVMFKNETHNHPTEIEPFGGAATCIGGCIRDPLSGRAYVYQAMRVTGAGDPRTPFSETLPGKLPQKKICQVAAHGYSSYGNQIGLATGQVAEVYHPGYVAKRLEIGAVVAAAPRSQVVRGTPAPGDVILLIGGRTGRDGVGGATGSSKEHTETALENSAEVQKGDAPTERKIQRLFRDPELTRRIKVCNDFGAGGVSVAIGEIAPSLVIHLDAVPKKYEGLDGTELAISESQERMAVCVDRADIEWFIRAADRENLECVHVADVTDSGRLVMQWRGRTIVDLSRAFLDTNGVQQSIRVQVAAGRMPAPGAAPARPLVEALRDLKHCSQRGLGERFDGSVGAGTVLWPFGGAHQLTPPDAMVAKLPVLDGDTEACTFMAWGFDPFLSAASPFHGAAHAVTESVCKAVAAGARLSDLRLTLQEYFPKPGTDPRRWGLPFAALLGAFHAQHGLRLAAIGGKDSMSGSFNDLDVPPTLVSFAVAPGRAGLALSPEFKQPDSAVSLVEVALDADGLPDYAGLRSTAEALHQLNVGGRIRSLHLVGKAGLGVALARMAFGNQIGFVVDPAAAAVDFSAARPCTFLVEHAADASDALRARLPGLVGLGRTTAEPVLALPGERHALEDLLRAWESTLEAIYPTRIADESEREVRPVEVSAAVPAVRPQPRVAIARPKVVIPAFPGTNSEYDSAKAFREAGGDAEVLVFRNLSAAHLEESLAELAARIRACQILMFPGGFSAGDEPDGSAKFIATIIRNPRVADAILDLIRHRDGLVLGICNGFQALIKTGLVPYGTIVGSADDEAAASSRPRPAAQPTLVHNAIGRHVSRYVHTRVESTRSPWLARCRVGDLHTVPVSHGEGRFFAGPDVLAGLAADGLVATRYCDPSGAPSMDIAFNPNGSLGAVEGLTSPCGRVFGKMAHSERAGSSVARNIPGEKHQPLFLAGVEYFR